MLASLYIAGWTRQTVPTFCWHSGRIRSGKQTSLVLKIFKGYILHNTHAHTELLLCDPLKWTRQDPDTVRAIEKLGWCRDNVCSESNFTRHWPNTKNPLPTLSDGYAPNLFRVNVKWNVGTVWQGLNHVWYEIKEEKTIFKLLAGIEPRIFGLLDRRVNHYTTRTNHAGNAAS